jgi:hypothetical protein
MVPGVAVNAAPSMLYSPPVMLIGAAAPRPAMTTEAEVTAVLTGAAAGGAANANASGVVSASPRVTVTRVMCTDPWVTSMATVVRPASGRCIRTRYWSLPTGTAIAIA